MNKPAWWYKEGCMCFGCKLISTPFGKNRRKMIMDFLSDKTDGWLINKRNSPQFNKDPDLKRLVKQGKLKLVSNKLFKVKK